MYNIGVQNVIFPSRLLKWRCDDDYDVSSLFFKQLPAFHTLHCEMKNKTRSHDLTLTKHYDLVIDLTPLYRWKVTFQGRRTVLLQQSTLVDS